MDLDLAFIFGEQGETATIAGQANVPVVATARNRNQENDDMGVMPMANVELSVRTASLQGSQSIGDLVTYANKVYRISNIDDMQDGNLRVFFLIDESQ